jgi:hypothetical protein
LARVKKILVCCPGASITGGPELLHQLVDALRNMGHNAYVCYYPFEQKFSCPEAYQRYDAPQALFEDTRSLFIVLPEVATSYTRSTRKAKIAIWWLSVDNFVRDRRGNFLTRVKLAGEMILLRRHSHFVQSQYAADFLNRYMINSCFLTDYLNPVHLRPTDKRAARQDWIVYNPKKGKAIVDLLSAQNPDFTFKPIENLTSDQVVGLLSTARVYIDFGDHPGRDRLPREAAVAGCCVITGRRGSAAFHQDVPIPDIYKLDQNAAGFPTLFRQRVLAIFNNFGANSDQFECYRALIREEPDVFRRQVAEAFGAP